MNRASSWLSRYISCISFGEPHIFARLDGHRLVTAKIAISLCSVRTHVAVVSIRKADFIVARRRISIFANAVIRNVILFIVLTVLRIQHIIP